MPCVYITVLTCCNCQQEGCISPVCVGVWLRVCVCVCVCGRGTHTVSAVCAAGFCPPTVDHSDVLPCVVVCGPRFKAGGNATLKAPSTASQLPVCYWCLCVCVLEGVTDTKAMPVHDSFFNQADASLLSTTIRHANPGKSCRGD